MPGLGQRLLGAAVAGAGAGILQQAQTRREEALLRLRRDWQVQDREALWAREDAKAAAAPPPAPTTATTFMGAGGMSAVTSTGSFCSRPRRGSQAACPAPRPHDRAAEHRRISCERNPGKTDGRLFQAAKRAGGVTVQSRRYRAGKAHVRRVRSPNAAEAEQGPRFRFHPATGQIRRDERGLPMRGAKRGKAATKAEERRLPGARNRYSVKPASPPRISTPSRDILKDSPQHHDGDRRTRFLSQIPSTGSAAHDLDRQRVDTLKAMIGFNTLSTKCAPIRRRAARSATSLSGNWRSCRPTVGSLELSQSREQFLENLALVEEQFNRVVHGPEGGAGPRPVRIPIWSPRRTSRCRRRKGRSRCPRRRQRQSPPCRSQHQRQRPRPPAVFRRQKPPLRPRRCRLKPPLKCRDRPQRAGSPAWTLIRFWRSSAIGIQRLVACRGTRRYRGPPRRA